MKDYGHITMDDVGRIVVPKEIRRILHLDKKNLVELYIDKDKLVVKKYSPIRRLTRYFADLCQEVGNLSSFICAVCDTDIFTCFSSDLLSGCVGKKLSSDLRSLIEQGNTVLVNASDGGIVPQFFIGQKFNCSTFALVPFLEGDAIVGAIMLFDLAGENQNADYTMRDICDEQISLLKLARALAYGMMERENS